MFAAVAELEAGIIKQRVKDAMEMKKEKGEFVGRIPYGWKLSNGKGSDLEEIPEQQQVITAIRQLREGALTEGKTMSYEDCCLSHQTQHSATWKVQEMES